jgi:hypothetical protein
MIVIANRDGTPGKTAAARSSRFTPYVSQQTQVRPPWGEGGPAGCLRMTTPYSA